MMSEKENKQIDPVQDFISTSKVELADKEDYRNSIATVDAAGKRIWMYPKKPSGNFYNARTIFSWFLLAFLFGAPFIEVNGHPLILLNVLERKFVLFGIVFWPQDFHLFALALLTFAVFIILFTVVFGRVFCGWACPQTIFLEMVFRKIEYFIEGDAPRQRALNKAPWTASKIAKKTTKHIIFYALSFLIGNIFLAYIIGVDALAKIITDPPSEHIAGLTAMFVFSTMFYGVFSWFREQACVIVCPYGRLQSVLLDQNSIVVSYDFMRGEPRGHRKRGIDHSNLGDCVDCILCVQVCPTGIDIRNGTQLECVNCTACIDACNQIMDKVEKPRGLIRYSSYNGIEQGEKLRMTPRIAGYSLVLVLLLSSLSFLLANRTPVETSVLRTPGLLYQSLDNGVIQNLYSLQIVNKSSEERQISLHLQEINGELILVGGGESLQVKGEGLVERAFFIQIPESELSSTSTKLQLEVRDGDKVLDVIQTAFAGPTR